MPKTTMMYIAHRGNVEGPRPHYENRLHHIDKALDLGFSVEIDVWGKNRSLWLGHDRPEIEVPLNFIAKRLSRLFIHCKNVEAIDIVSSEFLHPTFFFHHSDEYTITSNGLVWCYPGKIPPSKNAIVVLPELTMGLDSAIEWAQHTSVFGVCSDFVTCLKHK